MKDSKGHHKISISSLLDIYKPLDSIAKINHLIDAIKEGGGVISAEDKTNVYLKIWGPSLKSYWAERCKNELRITYLPPVKEKTVKKKKDTKSKSYSFANKVQKKQRNPGILDPNSADYTNQRLKENLRSKFADYEYGLSDW